MKKTTPLTFTIIDPNSPAAFEKALGKILLDKLLAVSVCPDQMPATD